MSIEVKLLQLTQVSTYIMIYIVLMEGFNRIGDEPLRRHQSWRKSGGLKGAKIQGEIS